MVKAHFSDIAEAIIKQLETAQKEISIAVAWCTNKKLYNQIILCLKDGIKVKLLIVNDHINFKSWALDFQHFIDFGGELHIANCEILMHHKYCIIDQQVIISGSYNWTYSADFNEENILILQDSSLAAEYKTNFIQLIEKSTPISVLTDYLKQNPPNVGDLEISALESVTYGILESKTEVIQEGLAMSSNTTLLKKRVDKFTNRTFLRTNESLGVEFNFKKFVAVIPVGVEAPYEGFVEIPMKMEYQGEIRLKFYQGNDKRTNKNKQFGEMALKITPKDWDSKIKLTFYLWTKNHLVVDIRKNNWIEKMRCYHMEALF